MLLAGRKLRDNTLYRIGKDWTHIIGVLIESERTVDIVINGPLLGA
jgi:hypothetical protein